MPHHIQIRAHGGPEVLDYREFTPAAPGPREVRVRNHAIGLNFIDIYVRSGLYPPPALPSGLGTEGAGTVEAVGEAVHEFRVGDRVAYCTGPLGAYADLHVLPADHLVALPDTLSFEQAAAVMLKGLTVQYLLRQTHVVQPGEFILFHAAAGGVGSLACQWAKALGARLIGVVGSDDKAAQALRLGAHAVINRRREDIRARVREITDGRKCSVVYDSVGQATWDISLDCVALRGLLVSYGNASGPVTGVHLGVLAQKGSLYVTRPTLGHYANTPGALRTMAGELFALLADGRLQVEIGQRHLLADAAQAHAALAAGETVGSTVLLP